MSLNPNRQIGIILGANPNKDFGVKLVTPTGTSKEVATLNPDLDNS